MIKEAILLAGGLGTRLQKAVPDLPKPMAPVNGRPFIEYVLDYLIQHEVTRFILSVGYKHEAFAKHFANDYKGCSVLFSVEKEPLGTGGGIKKALVLAEAAEVLVLNADTLFRFDLDGFYLSHKRTNADITIALRQMKDIKRYGSVEIDEDMRVTGFTEKSGISKPGYINGGIYLLKKDIFNELKLPEKFSIEKDFMEVYYNKLKMGGFPSRGYFLDIGIPEDYEKAQHDLK
ncbi:MAG: nucleotidyltransferase family protein [Bacteroidales bacterium]|jgi:D-glycero-alpha-D-manno-heptose 1-phosphate guanylyltransferase